MPKPSVFTQVLTLRLTLNGIYNPYQAVKVVYNKRLGKISIARKVDIEPNAIMPRIDEEEAIVEARKMTGDSVTFEQARLTYIDQSFTNSESNLKNGSSVCYLVYKVTAENSNLIVYLDALTGEYIGIDMTMSDNTGAFGIQESNDSSADNYTFYRDESGKAWDYSDSTINTLNSRRTTKIWLCVAAMRRLGYNPSKTIKSDISLIKDVRNYLNNDSNAYAFYFTGHGSPDVLGFKTKGWISRKSDIKGNWHFVFLDSCSTAVNTGWADAFKINGYSHRAFLGWNGTIDSYYGYLFALKFWPLIDGNRSVRQAAVDAAAGVDGDGTTPIKFYGDRSYNGRAWK